MPLTWDTQLKYALIFRSAGVQPFLICARIKYAKKSLARFSTAVPERPYHGHDYYPLCNTHFCRLLRCYMSNWGQPEPVWNSKAIPLSPWAIKAQVLVYLLIQKQTVWVGPLKSPVQKSCLVFNFELYVCFVQWLPDYNTILFRASSKI